MWWVRGCCSHPGVFVSWLLLSYPVGLLFLSLELWVLEGIFFALEQVGEAVGDDETA